MIEKFWQQFQQKGQSGRMMGFVQFIDWEFGNGAFLFAKEIGNGKYVEQGEMWSSFLLINLKDKFHLSQCNICYMHSYVIQH